MDFRFAIVLICILLGSCVDDRPFLSGYIKRAQDAVLTQCDPYNTGDRHTCVVYASIMKPQLYVYNASQKEMVLGPTGYFPLVVPVGDFTRELIDIKSNKDPVPFILALGAQSSMYVVKTFNGHKNKKTFSKPQNLDLDIGFIDGGVAFTSKDLAYVMLTQSNEKKVTIIGLDKKTGKIKNDVPKREFLLPDKPGSIAIDDEASLAAVASKESSQISIFDLKKLTKALKSNTPFEPEQLRSNIAPDEIRVQKRNFGQGIGPYVLVLNKNEKKISLIRIDAQDHIGSYELDETPLSLYFPGSDSALCCKKQKNWFLVNTLKAKLHYVQVNEKRDDKSLTKIKKINLLSNKHLGLDKIYIPKMIGGNILKDPESEIEQECKRKVFYVSSYASERDIIDFEENLLASPVEVESQGVSCEGDVPRLLGGADRD